MQAPYVSKEKPIHHRRIGYAETGYAFHLVRCYDHKALRDYVMKIPGVRPEPWFLGAPEAEETPDAFTVCTADRVLPGTIPEAVGDFLCEIHIAVVAQDDLRKEKRLWWHEIGHACAFGAPELFWLFHDNYGKFKTVNTDYDPAICEFPGQCSELLCDAVEAMFSGDTYTAESGFRTLFPWLKSEVAE